MSAHLDDAPTIRRMTTVRPGLGDSHRARSFFFLDAQLMIPSMLDTIAWYWSRKVIFLVTG